MQELASDTSQSQESLYRPLCHTLLSNLDVPLEQLQPRVWHPCLEAVASKLGRQMAGERQSYVATHSHSCVCTNGS